MIHEILTEKLDQNGLWSFSELEDLSNAFWSPTFESQLQALKPQFDDDSFKMIEQRVNM